MTAQVPLPLDPMLLSGKSAISPDGRDRRRRVRVQIEIPVRICGGHGTKDLFEEVNKTTNVTRDGLLVATHRKGYFVGDVLEVTAPYWENPTAINTPRKARVVRCAIMPDLRYAVALEYVSAHPKLHAHSKNEASIYAANPYPSQIRILAIESDPDMAFALRSMLEHDGYNVIVVSRACDALAILSTETPDALVIEAEGQDICGKDLCAIVKTNERLQHIPIIFLTSSALPSDYAAGHRLGAVVCMTKPCKPMHVRRAVHLVAPPPGERTVYSARFNMGPFVRTA
jgi:CheY-like chemotaxis protein